MGTDITPELEDSTYLGAVMSTVNFDGTPNLNGLWNSDGTPPVKTGVDADSNMPNLTITMPDGSSQYWQRVAETRTPTDYRGFLYERVDENGRLFLNDGENGGPERMLVIPGSQNQAIERETSLKIVRDENMNWRIQEAQKFAEVAAQYIQDSAEASVQSGEYGEHGFGYGSVQVFAHSTGVFGLLVSKNTLQKELGVDVPANAAAPYAPGKAVDDTAEFIAGDDASPEEIEAVKTNLLDNTAMGRPNEWTIVAELQVGNDPGNNQMQGSTYSYTPSVTLPDAKFLGSEYSNINVLSHATPAIINGILSGHSLEDRSIFANAHTPLNWDNDHSVANTRQFNQQVGGLVDLKASFNARSNPDVATPSATKTVVAYPADFDKTGFDAQHGPTNKVVNEPAVETAERPSFIIGSLFQR